MGFPSPAQDYAEERISLDKEIIKHPNSTYFMRVDGYAMTDAFIPPGALLVVDRSMNPGNMDIVVAEVNGELTVRYLKKNEYKSYLVPANRKMQDLLITPDIQVTIWGVVIAIVTEPKRLSHAGPC